LLTRSSRSLAKALAGADDWPVEEEVVATATPEKSKNDDALAFELAKVNLRKLWTAAYAEAALPALIDLSTSHLPNDATQFHTLEAHASENYC